MIKDYLILKLFKAHNAEMEAMLGVEFEPNTLKGYKTSLGHLQSYIKTKYKKVDLEIDRLDYSFIRDYDIN